MRFCPFCAAENADDATHCPSCAKRLPPVRPRKKETRPAPLAVPPTPTPSGEETVVDRAPAGMVKFTAEPTPAPDPTPLAIAIVEKAPVVLREPSQRVETHRPGKLVPMPDPPETGLWAYARYALAVWRGRYDRRRAARELGQEIKADVVSLDGVLGALGREVRAQKIVVPGLAEETRLIEDAEARRQAAERVAADLREKTSEENAKFHAAKERFLEKLAAGQRAVDDAGAALDTEEGKRKALREKRKELERRYRDLLKRAADREALAEKQPDEQRLAFRQSAEDHRKEAKGLEPERVDLDKQIAAAERPIEESRARVAQAKTDVEDTRQALDDVEAGHRQKLTELEAELSHQQGEAASARSEVARRTVTLGTLVNLHRLDRPTLAPHYTRVDELKAALASKESEIERLAIERSHIDRAALVRGIALIAGTFVLLATAVTVLVAVV